MRFFLGVHNTFPYTPLSEIKPKLTSVGFQTPKRVIFLRDLYLANFFLSKVGMVTINLEKILLVHRKGLSLVITMYSEILLNSVK